MPKHAITVKELIDLIHPAGPNREVVIECEGGTYPVVIESVPYEGPVVLRPDEPVVNEADTGI